MAISVIGTAAYFLSKSTRFQVFGELVSRGSSQHPCVALTLDDGPSPKYTAEVLDVLANFDAKATFFLTGQAVVAHPALVADIAAKGHEIGNHSFSHPRMVGMSQSRIESEVESTDRAIRAAGYTGPLHFRPPYGKRLLGLPYYLKKTNRLTVLWDIAPETDPTNNSDATEITRRTLADAKNGSIILLHVMFVSRAGSRAALPEILAGLQAKGFTFVTLSDLLQHKNCVST
ncbi:polysaccharide deacetylase family protein [uncultured Shimia sp.]|uniref:polysaccharide deacetylase family protein n=1 Tax=uncultured Shimia sp. TaxID=573152 RepID=UPI0025E916F4|nr:polysaccharide deacetylase family protein [uncultured Shimia sp.]